MKKGFFCCLSLIFLVVCVVESVAQGNDTDIGPEIITMKSASARKIAEFPHGMHQEMYVCMECHHVNGRKMTTQKCNTCHNEKMDNSRLNAYKKAGHRLCRDCHKMVKKEGMAAPTSCSGCHALNIQK